jgi:hypothetical protein
LPIDSQTLAVATPAVTVVLPERTDYTC